MKEEKRAIQLFFTVLILVVFLTKCNVALALNYFAGPNAGISNTTGNENVFVGEEAGRFSTTGLFNTFIGDTAGRANVEGNANTFIGFLSGALNNNGDLNTFVGAVTGEKNLGDFNTFIGYGSGENNTFGARNTYIGTNSGDQNMTGNGNVFLGFKAGFNETRSNRLYIANSSGKPLIYGDFKKKRVGINKKNPSYTLDVKGKIRGSSISKSDVRLKEDINTIENSLEKVEGLRGVNFKWIDKNNGKRTEIGVIAQEVERVIPEVVFEDEEGIKSVAYDKLVAVLIEAIKELKVENKQFKEALSVLVARQDTIEVKFNDRSTLPNESLVKMDQNRLDKVLKAVQ